MVSMGPGPAECAIEVGHLNLRPPPTVSTDPGGHRGRSGEPLGRQGSGRTVPSSPESGTHGRTVYVSSRVKQKHVTVNEHVAGATVHEARMSHMRVVIARLQRRGSGAQQRPKLMPMQL
jgi:hypothetical protein